MVDDGNFAVGEKYILEVKNYVKLSEDESLNIKIYNKTTGIALPSADLFDLISIEKNRITFRVTIPSDSCERIIMECNSSPMYIRTILYSISY